MDVVTKATASVTPVEDSKSKHGEFDVILSTNALDRDGDELHADEWKTPLPDKITFDSDHGMSVATCVGSGKPFINDQGQLQVRGTFASTPHGQAVRTLVNEGHIDSVSVAFMDRKAQKSGKPLRELLNGAFVAVPANPQARVLSSKSVPPATAAKAMEEHKAGLAKTPEFRVRVASGDSKSIADALSAAGLEYSVSTHHPLAYDAKDAWKVIAKGLISAKDAANYKLDEMAAINDMFQNDSLDSDDRPQRKEYWQGVHDVAVKLGAGCPYSDPQAQPDVLQSSNRSVHIENLITKAPAEPCNCECAACTCPSSKSLSQKSTDESTAAAEATAADDSADDVARAKALLITLADID